MDSGESTVTSFASGSPVPVRPKNDPPPDVKTGEMGYESPFWPTWRAMMSVTLPLLTRSAPTACRSSIVLGASAARSVFRISAMFSTEYGTPYSWPPNVMPLIAIGSNPDVSRPWIGSIALFWTKSPMTSCAQTTMSGGLPAWAAVLNFVWMSVAIDSTSTVTPFSVAQDCASGLIALARFSSAQMTRVAEPDAAGPDASGADAAGWLAGAWLAPPPPPLVGAALPLELLHALMTTANAASSVPNRF